MSKRQLSIIFAAGDLASGGGANRVIRDLSTIMTEQLKATVRVISIGASSDPTYSFAPGVVVETHLNGRPISWRDTLRTIRHHKPDFVIGSWTQANLMLILSLLISGIRLIVVEHTSWYFHPLYLRLLRRLMYPFAWRVIVLNPTEFEYYHRFLGNVRLLPNPVPAPPQVPVRERESLIVAVGHLEPRKNFVDAIKAMALARLEETGWALAIIGVGPEEQLLRDTIRDQRLTKTQIYPPMMDLSSWYDRASLTLVTAKLEVFSLVLAEAMSTGVVPFAYATDGPSFLLEEFPDHLVPIGDVEGLADRMRRSANEDIAASLRSELAASIERRFSPKIIGEKWRELLQER